MFISQLSHFKHITKSTKSAIKPALVPRFSNPAIYSPSGISQMHIRSYAVTALIQQMCKYWSPFFL